MNSKNMIIGGASVLGAAAIGGYVWLQSRRTIPHGVRAIEDFDLNRYAGTWYEIARMPMRYEKGLTHVSANYALNQDGTVRVINRGFDPKKEKWEEVRGEAKFVDVPTVGMLKVSFFGPFYSGYNVMAIDDDYKYVLVYGRNLDYMWLMSREKEMPKNIEQKYLEKAKKAGFDISRLVWTEQ